MLRESREEGDQCPQAQRGALARQGQVQDRIDPEGRPTDNHAAHRPVQTVHESAPDGGEAEHATDGYSGEDASRGERREEGADAEHGKGRKEGKKGQKRVSEFLTGRKRPEKRLILKNSWG